MGNRAVLAFSDEPKAPGLYLHWNGGVESILALLDVANEQGIWAEDSAVLARLAHIMSVYYGDAHSIHSGTLAELHCDNGDNGLYILGWGRGNKLVVKARKYGAPNKHKTIKQFSTDARVYYESVRQGILDKLKQVKV